MCRSGRTHDTPFASNHNYRSSDQNRMSRRPGQWPTGTTKETILQRLVEKLRLPGATNIWTQPIRNRIDMLSTGIRTEVFGSDLTTIEQKETEIELALRPVRGIADLYSERVTGALYLEIKINREAAARYGINVGDVQDVIETAIGGKNLTTAIDGRQRLPVRVRHSPDFRQDPEELRNNVLVTASNGVQIPLGQVPTLVW
jgi:copper/silver efflux system protein